MFACLHELKVLRDSLQHCKANIAWVFKTATQPVYAVTNGSVGNSAEVSWSSTDLDVNKFKLTWRVGVMLCHHLPLESSSFCSSSPAQPLAQALHQNLTKAHPQHQT